MVLTAASVARYLLGRGLVRASCVVDGELRIEGLSRRNRVFRCTWNGGGCIVKQVREWTPIHIDTLEREARFYWLMRTEPALGPLARLIPECYAHDATYQVLVLQLISGLGDPIAASLVGETLRSWHDRAQVAVSPYKSHFKKHPPWALSMHDRQEDPEEIGPANTELLAILRRHDGFGHALGELRDQWQGSTLIHGDLKWSHCIASSGDRLRFVDWEMAMWGDPLWDAAGILHEYLIAWVSGGGPPSGVAEQMRLFWRSYNGNELERALSYAAARMIQSVWERHKEAREMTAPGVRMLQASLNILAAPRDAVAVFFP